MASPFRMAPLYVRSGRVRRKTFRAGVVGLVLALERSIGRTDAALDRRRLRFPILHVEPDQLALEIVLQRLKQRRPASLIVTGAVRELHQLEQPGFVEDRRVLDRRAV
jgi:hypothetical protein